MKTPEERLTRGKGNFINCTDYDNAIEAMKEHAIEYHEQQVKKMNIPDVIKSVCECSFAMIRRDEKTQKAYCFKCKKEIQE